MTTVNMAQVLGAAVLPALSGFIVEAMSRAGAPVPETAYRAVFGMLAAGTFAGLMIYLRSKDRSKDSRPNG